MARTSKSKTTTESVADSVPVPSVPVMDSTPSDSSVPKEKKPRVVKKVVKSKDADEVVPSVTLSDSIQLEGADVSSSQSAPVVDNVDITEQSIDFLTRLQQLSVLISSIKSDYRLLEKKWLRDLKVAQKQSSRRKRKSGNRAPSGFVKPTKISDELASFLGKESGTEMARTAVTRDINTYIRTNKLQDASNGRKINPDSKLSALLKLKKTDELTYFNLQRYMSPHFCKSVKPGDVVPVVATVGASA